MEPRNVLFAGADVLKTTEGRVAAPQWPGVRDPAGVREQDTFTRVPQEPGRPRRLRGKSRVEVPGDQLQARGRRIRRPRERNAGATEVPPSEGNEARREGRQGVGAPHTVCWAAS